TGGLPAGNVEYNLRELNQLFRQAGIQFFIYGSIDHINDDTHFNIPNVEDNQNALRRVNTVPNTINIYYTTLPSGQCGISSFTTYPAQGVLMSNTCGTGLALAH